MELKYLRMKIGLMYSTERFYIHKWTTSNNQVCTKLKEHLHCSSWIIISYEPSRVISMDEPNIFTFFFTLITMIYLKMAAAELVRLGTDAVC